MKPPGSLDHISQEIPSSFCLQILFTYTREKHVNCDIFGNKMRCEGLLLFYFEQVVTFCNQIQANLSYFVKTYNNSRKKVHLFALILDNFTPAQKYFT